MSSSRDSPQTALDVPAILREILAGYALPWDADHGVAHWARVWENGLKLCESEPANPEIVRLFAVFHDSRRVNECHDPQHGLRGALLARQLHGRCFQLTADELDVLCFACEHDTDIISWPEPTIQCCWDADRLDLGRVGITPDPQMLGTATARRRETINWAHGRACFGIVPGIVAQGWGLEQFPAVTPNE